MLRLSQDVINKFIADHKAGKNPVLPEGFSIYKDSDKHAHLTASEYLYEYRDGKGVSAILTKFVYNGLL